MKRISVFCAALLIAGCSLGYAADPRPVLSSEKPVKPATPATPKKAKPVPYTGPIAATDGTTKTLTIGKNKLRVLQVTAETKISVDNKPGTFEQLVAGAYVSGSYRQNADGRLEAIKINTADVAKSAKAKEDATGKKEPKK